MQFATQIPQNYQSNVVKTVRNLKSQYEEMQSNSEVNQNLSVIQSIKEESDEEKKRSQKQLTSNGKNSNNSNHRATKSISNNANIQQLKSQKTTAETSESNKQENTPQLTPNTTSDNNMRQINQKNMLIKRNVSAKIQQAVDQRNKVSTIDIAINVLQQRSKKFQSKMESGEINAKFFQDYLQKNKHFQYSFYDFFGKMMQKDKELQPDLQNLKQGQLIKIEMFIFQKYEESYSLYEINKKYGQQKKTICQNLDRRMAELKKQLECIQQSKNFLQDELYQI